MPSPSRYPGFHRHVTKAYLVIICALAVGLPILHLFTRKPNIKQIIGIIIFVIVSYVVYWLIVRLNCYGTPLPERRTGSNNNNNNDNSNNNNNNNTSTIYTQPPPRSNSSTSTHSSSNGTNNQHQHPTFATYRLGGLAEIFRRFGGSSTANDDEETGDVLRPPPPTYNTALEGAGLPPPYVNDPIDINVNNSESPQMSERNVLPRRPVPSIPSSSSLRRPAPPIPPQQSSTQSIQDASQDPSSSIMSDLSPRRPVPSIPQLSGRPVPPIPTSLSSTSSSSDNISQPPRRPVPPVPATSSLPRSHTRA